MALYRQQHIIYQNENKTVTLIDVPHSITAAQGTTELPCNDDLRSTTPLDAPYPSNEPKKATAKAKVQSNTVDEVVHTDYRLLIDHALAEIRNHRHDKWCLPRPYITASGKAKKRKRKLNEVASNSDDAQAFPEGLLRSLADNVEDYAASLIPLHHNRDGSETDAARWSRSAFNSTVTPKSLTIKPTGKSLSWTFNLPPQSSFHLGMCEDSRSFHAAVQNQAQQQGTRRHFDFILLDPPWPNRSVKRTHQTEGSTYQTSTDLRGVRELLLDMDLDILMAPGCLVGVWATNKPAICALVRGEDGIFACWGVKLVEEWIWLKTTSSGEPVTPLDSVWRKPYEILFLGRKQTADTSNKVPEVQRRVLVSVPDLHSRKPCLKSLIEPMMEDPGNYRALEVFSRHLVAEWWSWGNECIKFQWDGNWRKHGHIQEGQRDH